MRVGGLDLARRRDFSALVTLDVTAEGGDRDARRCGCRRRPIASSSKPDRAAPRRARRSRLRCGRRRRCRSASSCPKSAIPIVIVGGDGLPRLHQGRWRIGKVLLIQNVLVLAGRGRLVVPPICQARELAQSSRTLWSTPTRRGIRMAARGPAHDDLVLALALAVIAVRLKAEVGAKEGRCRPTSEWKDLDGEIRPVREK